MTVSDALTQNSVQRLGFDTAPIIYYVEKVQPYFPVCEAFFGAIRNGTVEGFAGAVTLTVVLVKPLITNDRQTALDFRRLLTRTGEMKLISINSRVATRAADLRAKYRLRTADALQIAAALHANCDAFLTNDRDLKRVTELTILVTGELTT